MSYPTCAVRDKDALATRTWCGKILTLTTPLATTNAAQVRCKVCEKEMARGAKPDHLARPEQMELLT